MDLEKEFPRNVLRFISRTQNHLKSINLEPETVGNHYFKSDIKDAMPPANGHCLTYGRIDLKDFKNLIDFYDNVSKFEKEMNRTIEDPISTMDSFKNKSFKELLYSQPGFYQPHATSFIAGMLGIKNIHRSTFLSEFSYYKPRQGESLNDLKEAQSKYWIQEFVTKAHELMSKNEIRQSYEFIEKALAINPRDGDALICRGRHNTLSKRFDEATNDFQEAGNDKSADKKLLRKYYSENAYNIGLDQFNKRNYRHAIKIFEAALNGDPTHEGAKIHLNMCRDNLMKKK